MLGRKNEELVSKFLDVIFSPVANADCEEVFSNDGDVVFSKRTRMLTVTILGIVEIFSVGISMKTVVM